MSRRTLTLSAKILIGLGLGLAAGLLFGDDTAVLQPIADVYIRLMQMTVLPYLVLALVIGFGQLEPADAKRLAKRAGVLLLVMWTATFAVIAATPLAFPGMQTASFFSNNLVDPAEPFSIPDLYFPANPFNSLANAVVPAIVLFSSLFGVALMGTPRRERLLEPLRAANGAVVSLTRFISHLTPLGVFAIVSVTAGTMRLSTLQRLEVYFIAFIGVSLVLAFCILPLMVTAVAPFKYREIVGIAPGALVTAFVTNNAFIVLPILVEHSKDLLARHGLLNADNESATDILIPILFNFPNAGRLLTLLFVPFAAWLAGSSFAAHNLALLFVVGVPSYFAKAQVALPFLLDMFELPHDLFQLYIPTTILTGKFDSLVTAMNLLVFAVLGAAGMGGRLRMERRRLVGNGIIMLAATIVTLVAVRVVLHGAIDTTYRKDQMLLEMRGTRTAPTRVHGDRLSLQPGPRAAGVNTLEAARARGSLRVGYDPANVPFSFFNTRRELVGFDVELAQQLADSLGFDAEFVPISWAELPKMLAAGEIDIMPGMWVRPFWFSRLQLSDAYFTGTVGVVVRDERRQEFAQADVLRRRSGLTVGVPLDSSQLEASMQRYFNAATHFVRFESPAEYFERDRPEIDAFLMPAEAGAAATLLHPEYTVVVPQPHPVRLPYAFGIAFGDQNLLTVVNEWILSATSEGVVERDYAYWVLGEGAENVGPRWSILRNVLGWERKSD